jgi:hypothetical protein
MALALALAFYKVNDRSFVDILGAGFNFYTKDRLYLWRKEEKARQAAQVPQTLCQAREKLGLSGKSSTTWLFRLISRIGIPKELTISMASSKPTQEFVPVEEVRGGVVILKNGGYRGIMMCSSLNFALKSEDEQRAIIGGFQNFLNTLDFSVQIVVHSRKTDIRPYLRFFRSAWSSREASSCASSCANTSPSSVISSKVRTS